MEHNIDQATKNYTIFCDLDGTLWEQGDPTEIAKPGYQPKIIHGTVDKIREWDSKGFKIILTTGRKESLRDVTVKQLSYAGIVYDQLVMGIGRAERILINNKSEERPHEVHSQGHQGNPQCHGLNRSRQSN
jgi:ribonucleotide monophosphatase NagD (HAD superfamily)